MCAFDVPLEGGTARGARACIHDNCYDCCFEFLCWPDWPGETRARAGVSPARVREEASVYNPAEDVPPEYWFGNPVDFLDEDFDVIF